MKLLSLAIPCYNSQDYMEHCIESLLPGGDKVEILIINDGSTDRTAEIADHYQQKYPSIIKAIHQTNGGHGEAVNTGIRNAVGLYFKVVDSDDWIDGDSYKKVLNTLGKLTSAGEAIDMLICNYVYEKMGAAHKIAVRYNNVLPEKRIFSWDDVGTFRKGRYMLMHSVIYRTKLLHDCKLVLPKHTFYVDNLFVYIPLPYVTKLYYLNVDLYRYFIGRIDQSINEQVMISRIDQQIKVNKLMFELVDLNKVTNQKCRKYMLNYLEIITTVSTILLMRSGTFENLVKKQDLWRFIKEKDDRLFYRLRRGVMGTTVNLPGKAGRVISLAVYRISKKIVGFN